MAANVGRPCRMKPIDCYHATMRSAHVHGQGPGARDGGRPGGLTAHGDRVRLEVRHLKLVRAVVREQGLTRAAAHLHLTQPALSHQLAELESRLGTALFVRAGRRLVPPPAGERLVETAESVLPELERAEQELAGLEGAGGGVIRVSTRVLHRVPLAARRPRGLRPPLPRRVRADRGGGHAPSHSRPARGPARSRHRVRAQRQPPGRAPPAVRRRDGGGDGPGSSAGRVTTLTPAQFAPETLILYAIPIRSSDLFQRFLVPGE